MMGPHTGVDLMPISDGMHPSERPDAGETKGDAVPAPPAPAGSLYVVTSYVWDDRYWLEGLGQPSVHTTAASANAAARALMDRYAEVLNELGDADEFDFQHNVDQERGDVGLYNGKLDWKNSHTAAEIRVFRADGLERMGGEKRANGKGEDGRKTAVKDESPSDEEEDDSSRGDEEKDDEEEEDEEETKPSKRSRSLPSKSKPAAASSTTTRRSGRGNARAAAPPKTAVQASTYRKKIPEGKPNCLRGLKLLFTGTFETMDRRTSIATAVRYGGEVVTKLEDTDYIVVGLRAGPKKLQEINEKELETINEDEFFHILENGVSKEKRQRMAARRRADEEAREAQESDGDGDDRAAARGRGLRKRARR